MSQTTEDILRRQMSPMVQGMWLAMESMLMLLDDPGMDLETLRRSPPAKQFRGEVESFRRWVRQAINMLPETTFPPEERRFIEHWLNEFNRREVNRAVVVVKRDGPRTA